jgi:hypothetical protein
MNYVDQGANKKTLEIPDSLLMLTPYYSFNFVDIPRDFSKF